MLPNAPALKPARQGAALANLLSPLRMLKKKRMGLLSDLPLRITCG